MTDRPKRPPAPALPAFDALDAVHAQILEHLGRLDRLPAMLADKGLDPAVRKIAAEASTFFGGVARQHHADEDRLVFPSLLHGGPAHVVEQVHRLQQDHGWLEEDWRTLQPHVEAVAEGIGGYDLEMMRRAIPIFSTLYREHIAVEESMVYPAAKRQQAALDQAAQTRSDK